ncbi:MAG: hypothetical protein P9L94_18960 [Candidatus Hinthialibacter antarcticus]|nr:hypothetical protein [Candidatus Hinthialibacter antarcticus]
MLQRIQQTLRSALPPIVFFGTLFLLAELLFFFRPPFKQPDPYHTSFHTHDGRPISTTEGPVKLALSPYLLYKTIPNQETEYFSINSIGLRGDEVGAKDPSQKRVLILGASTAFGFGAKGNGETFAALLDADPTLEVINASVIGYNSMQELRYFETELLALEPDYVITFDAYADIFDAWHRLVALGKEKTDQEMNYNMLVLPQIQNELTANYHTQTGAFAALGRFMRVTLRKSACVRLLDDAVKNTMERSIKNQRRAAPCPEMSDEYFNKTVRAYTDNLLRIAQICRENKIGYTAGFQPELGGKQTRTEHEDALLDLIDQLAPHYKDHYPAVYQRFIDASNAVLSQQGVDTLDVTRAPEFAASPETLFVDSAHFTKRGNQIVAELLGENFQEALN